MDKQTDKWIELIAAIKDLFEKRGYYEQIDDELKVKDIRTALDNPHQRSFALHLLKDMSMHVKICLFDKVVKIGIDGSAGLLSLVREIIFSINIDWLESNLYNEIENILSKNNIEQLEYTYRNTAELLSILNNKISLLKFLNSYCKNSRDEYVYEIYSDYIEKTYGIN